MKKKLVFLIFQFKIQAAKSNGENLNPLEDATGVDSVDFSADIDNIIGKIDKLKVIYDSGKIDADILRYIPGMNKIMYQEQIDWTDTKKTYAASTYTDMEILRETKTT